MPAKLVAVLLSAALAQVHAAEMKNFHLIPRPAKMTVQEGSFTITPQTAIVVTEDTLPIGQYLAELLAPATGFELDLRQSCPADKQANSIFLLDTSARAGLGEEGYELKVGQTTVFVNGVTPAGVFYGCQTLRQLLPAAIESKEKVDGISWTIPKVEIKDKPRYGWRGMHLDVARHFFSKKYVKKYIDLLALYKMNRFHWHLTEDQGWRIEIKKYPEQDDIREVVRYAKERFITVIPEIEMPGHTQAVLAAFPQLSCTGGPFEVGTKWGIYKEVFCAGNDQVFQFLENVLSEVIDLFDGPYIHIGGDECLKDRWKQCPRCQAGIKAEGLKDEHELQSYFIKRIDKFLESKNRRLIGWDEILEGGLSPNATVQSWRGIKGGITAARAGHDAVMSPRIPCYFNYKRWKDQEGPGHSRRGGLALEQVYSYQPTPAELSPKEARHILGAQGNVWTEFIPTSSDVEFMAFPRMCALAEVVWSPSQLRNWDDFKKRLRIHAQRLDKLGLNYYRNPQIWPNSAEK
jgi:hexosaminidase